eukprot:g658.t1
MRLSSSVASAIQSGDVVALQALIDQSESAATVKLFSGVSPIHLACLSGFPEVISLILSTAGVSVLMEQDALLRFPVACCVEKGHVDASTLIIGKLTEKKWARKMLLRRDSRKMSCIHLAARCENIQSSAALLKQILPHVLFAEDIYAKSSDNLSPIDWAAARNASESLALLLKYGRELPMEEGEVKPLHCITTPALLVAAREGHSEVAKILVENEANPDVADEGLMTPAHWSFALGHVELGNWLLSQMQNKDAKNDMGKTAKECAPPVLVPTIEKEMCSASTPNSNSMNAQIASSDLSNQEKKEIEKQCEVIIRENLEWLHKSTPGKELKKLCSDFVKSVLKNQPTDIRQYAAKYFCFEKSRKV